MKDKEITLLKYSLVIVYIWFGLLKFLGVSPVGQLVASTYPNFGQPSFLILLGLWEILIGLFLLSTKTLKVGILLMWLQMAGIFIGVVLNPSLYFLKQNLFLLTSNGEFVVKNLVLLAASYSLWKSQS